MMDNETGEVLIQDTIIGDCSRFDQETGEVVAESQGEDEDELVERNMIYQRCRSTMRKSKFNVPKSYLHTVEGRDSRSGDETSRCYLTESFSLTDKRRVIDLKEEIFLGYNKFSYRLFLIPSIFFFNKIGAIYVVLLELLLHIWAHKKNNRNKNPKIYYRSPLHSLTSHFCNFCRENFELQELRRYHHYHQQKFMATSF